MGKRSFMKEKQNSPMSDDSKIFDPDRMRFFIDFGDFLQIEGTGAKIYKEDLRPYGAIDPATGQTKPKTGSLGDFTCILMGYTDDKGRLFVFKDYTKRVPPSRYIEIILDWHDECLFDLFGIEVNLYRNLLDWNIKQEEGRRIQKRKRIFGHRIPIHEIDRREKKEKEIYPLEPKVEFGKILFNKTLSNEFMDQMIDFPKGDHDDAPDCLSMLWETTHKHSPVRGIRV